MTATVSAAATTIQLAATIDLIFSSGLANQRILAIVYTHDATVTNVTASSGVPGGFTLRATVDDRIQVWQGFAPAPLVGVTITGHLSGVADSSIVVLAIDGAALPIFDPHPSLPATSGPDDVIGQQVAISTTNPDTLLIYACGTKGPFSSIANPTGWTSRGYSNYGPANLRVSTLSVTDPQSALDVNPAMADDHENVSIGDAINSGVPPIPQPVAKTLVAVEIDLHDGTVVETLRLCSGRFPLAATVDGVRVQYDPRLHVPLQFGTRIAAEQYGAPLRGIPNAGSIEFALDEPIWPKLEYHWKGRAVRVYLAEPGDDHDDFELVFTGRVDELTHDTLKGSIKTSHAGMTLDGPLVTELFPDTAPEALRGRPYARLWGQRFCIAPTLETEATQSYHVSSSAIAEMTVRVGGVEWEFAAGTPSAGQWGLDPDTGNLILGGVTFGGEVRVDAKAVGWDTLTTAALFRQIVEEAGGQVDDAAMTALDAAAPYLVGFYTSIEPVNRFDALDRIMHGVGGWWAVRMSDGVFTAGVLADSETATRTLTALSIAAVNQTQLVPPAWRIRVEHSGNEHPQTQFFDEVSEADQQKWRSTGIVAPPFEDASIKTAEPLAVDVPLIHSLVNSQADAIAIRDRLSTAWRVARKLYEVVIRDDVPALYDTLGVDYLMIDAVARVHSVLRSVGGGASAVQLWSEQLPANLYSIAHPEAITEEGTGLVIVAEVSGEVVTEEP